MLDVFAGRVGVKDVPQTQLRPSFPHHDQP